MVKSLALSLITLTLFVVLARADTPAPLNSVHESLKAYPDAKISAKDLNGGMTVYVESNGRSIVGLSKEGSAIWITEVIEKNFTCVGSPVIRHIEILKNKIRVTFCKHSYGEISLHSGEYKFLGSN